jgi:peptide/nickel transport system substrate-binding protein
LRKRPGTWVVTLCGALALVVSAQGADRPSRPVPPPIPTDAMTVRMAEPGRYGGRFVLATNASPKTFNPMMSTESSSNEVIQQMFVGLTDIDYATQEDIPMLARSWAYSDAGRTITFRLRRGACFSDGQPITSADCAFSFEVALDERLASPKGDDLRMQVGTRTLPFRWETPDAHTFVVHAPATDALMLSHVSNVRILPRHVLEPAFRAGRFASTYTTATAPESLVTNGPWRLKSYREGEATVLERNPHWFGVDSQRRRLPYLDQLVFRIARDQDAIATMFAAGEVDAIDKVKPEDYRLYAAKARSGAFTLHDVGPSFTTNFLWFNLNRTREDGRATPKVPAHKYAWFTQRDFRRAVSMALDREAMIRGPLYGFGVKGWAILTQGNARWHDPSISAPDHQPAEARRLLERLGMVDRDGDGVREDRQGNKLEFSLLVNSGNNVSGAMAALVQDDLAKVGIRVTLQPLDFKSLVSRTRDDQRYEACLLGLGSAVPADPGMGANFWKSTGSLHYWSMNQPEGSPDTPAEARMDAAFARNIGTVDLAARKRAYREMAQILNDEAFVVWLPTQVTKLPVSSRFGNVHPSPMPPRILWNSDRLFEKVPRKG